MSSPCSTARAPPGQKSFWTSMTTKTASFAMLSSLLHGASYEAFGPTQMWHVEHFAIESDHAPMASFAEGGDDVPRPFKFLVRRREYPVDDGDLIRVDCELSRETVASGGLGLCFKAGQIAIGGMNGIDRLHASGAGADQAKAARQPIGIGILPRGSAIAGSAKLDRQVLPAPGQS